MRTHTTETVVISFSYRVISYALSLCSDYHNPLADDSVPVEMSSVELAAFERGRMQGEIESIRRLEAEGRLDQPKTFAQDTTVMQSTLNSPNIVEINQMTIAQWTSAILGE